MSANVELPKIVDDVVKFNVDGFVLEESGKGLSLKMQ